MGETRTMRKRSASLLLAALLSATLGAVGCSGQGNAPQEGPAQVEGVEAEAGEGTDDLTMADYRTGTPWLCIDLDGVVTPDTAADITDNFALAVNKDEILSLELGEGSLAAGPMQDVAEQSSEDVKQMFLGDAPQSHDAKLAYDFFWLTLDWDGRDRTGIAPLAEEVKAVEAIDGVDALGAYYLETPMQDQLYSLWLTSPITDINDSSKKILEVTNSGLVLGDAPEYDELTDYGASRKEALGTLARKMLVRLGYTEAEADLKFENCLTFEGLLAPYVYSGEQKRKPDYDKISNNRYTAAELIEAEGQLPVIELSEQVGYPRMDAYLIPNTGFLGALNAAVTDRDIQLAKDYLIVHGVITSAEFLDRQCNAWANEVEETLAGPLGDQDEELAVADAISGTLKWPVAQLYAETYLNEQDKDRIDAVVDEVVTTYHEILRGADFLSDETRAHAIEKLDAMRINVLYPDDWAPYSAEGLNFASKEDGGTYWDAHKAIEAYELAEEVRGFSRRPDETLWGLTPQTPNCSYDRTTNSINICGAYARGDIYNAKMSDEEVLAKLGTTIAHEISHGFDSKGSQYDRDGNMANWWTDEDLAEFEARNEKLKAYYRAIHPWEGQDLNVDILTGEACADMAGMKAILKIAEGRKDFDYDAFFRAYADLWLTKDSLDMIEVRLNDTHPLLYLRINATLQQYDEFLDTYGIKEGDNMYLAPEDRVAIW